MRSISLFFSGFLSIFSFGEWFRFHADVDHSSHIDLEPLSDTEHIAQYWKNVGGYIENAMESLKNE